MPMINFSQPLSLFVAVVLFILILWFAKQSKKSLIMGIMLFTFITILVGHGLQFTLGGNQINESEVIQSIIFDLVFIFLSFISYLWIDDVEAKAKKKKSIDNSLEWFWNKV